MSHNLPEKIHDRAHIKALVARYLKRNGLDEFTPKSRVFVQDSEELIVPSSGAKPWVDFQIDTIRCGSWFRVTYSLSLTKAGWGTDICCSSPAGLPLAAYGMEVGRLFGIRAQRLAS